MGDGKVEPIGVGIIGLGARGFYSIGANMAATCPELGLKVVALCDRNEERTTEVAGALTGLFGAQGIIISPRTYTDGLDLIRDPAVDLVVVTSVTDTHRQFAVPALRSGKRVYCDKPLAQNAAEAVAIVEAEEATGSRLIMGFTRRYEAPWLEARRLLAEGVIGDLVMIQVRNIIPYHRYLMSWWRRREWSGGALSDKGCHLFDVFNWFSGGRALRVHGFGGRSMVVADSGAPERCSECDRACDYRRRELGGGVSEGAPGLATHFGSSWIGETEERHRDDVCIYAPGADIYRNGAVQISYDNGVIASYFFSFLGPAAEDQETMELVGTTGRMILTRASGRIDVVSDRGQAHEVIDGHGVGQRGSHFGADVALLHELRAFCEGESPRVSARDGLEATRMAMAALQSMDRGGRAVDMGQIADARV